MEEVTQRCITRVLHPIIHEPIMRLFPKEVNLTTIRPETRDIHLVIRIILHREGTKQPMHRVSAEISMVALNGAAAPVMNLWLERAILMAVPDM